MLQFHLNMTQTPAPESATIPNEPLFYCPQCALEVRDPLTCGDCAALICRRCGSPLESADDLGIG